MLWIGGWSIAATGGSILILKNSSSMLSLIGYFLVLLITLILGASLHVWATEGDRSRQRAALKGWLVIMIIGIMLLAFSPADLAPDSPILFLEILGGLLVILALIDILVILRSRISNRRF